MRSRIKSIFTIGASILLLCLTVSSCQPAGIVPQEEIMLDDDDEEATGTPGPQEEIMLDDDDEDPTSGPEP